MFAASFGRSLTSDSQKNSPFCWSFFRKVRPVSYKINTPVTTFRHNKGSTACFLQKMVDWRLFDKGAKTAGCKATTDSKICLWNDQWDAVPWGYL